MRRSRTSAGRRAARRATRHAARAVRHRAAAEGRPSLAKNSGPWAPDEVQRFDAAFGRASITTACPIGRAAPLLRGDATGPGTHWARVQARPRKTTHRDYYQHTHAWSQPRSRSSTASSHAHWQRRAAPRWPRPPPAVALGRGGSSGSAGTRRSAATGPGKRDTSCRRARAARQRSDATPRIFDGAAPAEEARAADERLLPLASVAAAGPGPGRGARRATTRDVSSSMEGPSAAAGRRPSATGGAPRRARMTFGDGRSAAARA